MSLQLSRPLCFLDIEGTGLNCESDRIVELSLCFLYPNGERKVKTRRFNPGIHIPAEATAVHGITDEDVAGEPSFRQLAASLHALIDGCDIGGYGSNRYDIPLLYNEFLRAGINWDYSNVNFIDAGNIFKINEPRDLSAACKFYLDTDHEGAHGAEADAKATLDVFLAQCHKYELPSTVSELALYCNYGKRPLDLSGKFTFNEQGTIIFNFGPNRGKPVADHMDFVMWMHSKDFAPDTRAICETILFNPRWQEVLK